MLHRMKGIIWIAGMVFAVALGSAAQEKKTDPVDELAALLEPSRRVIYKPTVEKPLQLCVFEPEGFQKTDKRAAFVTIHGGGWCGGVPRRMFPFADYFAKLGMVGISVE